MGPPSPSDQPAADERHGNAVALMALLFFGTCLAYLDRQVLSLLKPSLQAAFGWNDTQFAHMGSAFSLTTAAAVLLSGWIVDRVGVRRSYAWAMALWSLVGMGHALAATVGQFVAARVLLAVGESVNGPAAVKAAAQYLSSERRSFALGLITASTNIGAILAPLAVPMIAGAFGWRAGFVATGILGLVWLVFWLRQTAHLTRPAAPRPETKGLGGWRAIFTSRYTIAIVLARLVADWVFWVLLFWSPDLFVRVFHLSQTGLALPVALLYVMAAFGALGCGVAYPLLLRLGMSSVSARLLLSAGFACLALPLAFVTRVAGPWVGAAILGTAMLAHNGFSTNLFGIIADNVVLNRVARVMALGSVASNVSGFVAIELAGRQLQAGNGYQPLLTAASLAYLAATGLLWIIAMRKPIR